MKSVILSSSVVLGIFLLSHYVFDPTHLYDEIWWLDIPMHIAGGAAVTWFAVTCSDMFGYPLSRKQYFMVYLAIAGLWECAEYIRGMVIYDSIWKYADTVKDLIDGALGTWAVVRIANK